MKYSGIQTNSNLRFIECPVCGNDEFSDDAEFCRICGSSVINYCQDLYDENGLLVSGGCGKPNHGDARFCEYCGNPTVLHRILTCWEDEKLHSQKYGDTDTDSCSNSTDNNTNNNNVIRLDEKTKQNSETSNIFTEFFNKKKKVL